MEKPTSVAFDSEDANGNAGTIYYVMPAGFDFGDGIDEETASTHAVSVVWILERDQ